MTKVSRSATSNSVSMDRIDWLDHAFLYRAGVAGPHTDQDPGRHDAQAPPGNPGRRPLHQQQRHEVPMSSEIL
jgi:hypothetical protein